MSEDVIARVEGAVGRITLNRPKALHALNTAMCEAIIAALLAWRHDPSVELVLIDHSGERGFCAGGDIRMLAESGAKDGLDARRFFFTEYRMNALLMSYPKPVCAIIDGIVMGGGVGISLPCAYRVATERTTFAMPETGIGLFPDVGGGWHLPRLPGEAGLWLALTGARIKAADCLLLGIATDYVESGQVEALKAAIVADPSTIETILTEYEADAGEPPIAQHQDAIDAAFTAPSVEAILQALREDGSAWAIAQHDTLLTKSPQTMKVAFRQLRTGQALTSFEANMAMEYRIGARVVARHDFLEGVRAVIVDKDNAPRWSPSMLEGVTDAMLDEIFAPLPTNDEWTPLR
jgi:enoyl-CoA hydratase